MKWKALKSPCSTPQINKKTMNGIIGACLALFAIVIARLAMLQVVQHDELSSKSSGQHSVSMKMSGLRGTIFDRTHETLAKSAARQTISLEAHEIKDPQKTIKALEPIIPLSERQRQQIRSQRGHIQLRRQAPPEISDAIKALNLPGVHMEQEGRRTYPKGTLAGALLGFTNIDDQGKAGLEQEYESYLSNKTYSIDVLRSQKQRIGLSNGNVPVEQMNGNNLELTIDSRIQQIAETALQHQIEAMQAQSGVVVVMDPRNGDLLAMAQTPIVDPNHVVSPKDHESKILTHVYEPGSIIKPLLVAGALDSGKVRTDTMFSGFGGSWRINSHKTVHDSHYVKEMNTLEVLKFSSNIGAAQIGQRMGKELYHSYLRAFGLGESTGLKSNESSGKLDPPRKWGQTHLATISYGYGLSVTAVQMARAYSAIANGGLLMQPRLVSRITDARGQTVKRFPERVLRRVISEKTAREVTKGLVMVTSDGGTGKRGRVHGYTVAGKTGTADLIDATGRYMKNRTRASFVGFAPAEDPRIVIVVTIEDPVVARSGGSVSAPVFSAIAKETLAYLGVQATTDVNAREDEEEEESDLPIEIAAQSRPWWFTNSAIGDHQLVPELKDMPLAQALAELAPLGFNIHVEGQGCVAEQTPQAGALLPHNAEITLRLNLLGEIRLKASAHHTVSEQPAQRKKPRIQNRMAPVAVSHLPKPSQHSEDEDLP